MGLIPFYRFQIEIVSKDVIEVVGKAGWRLAGDIDGSHFIVVFAAAAAENFRHHLVENYSGIHTVLPIRPR